MPKKNSNGQTFRIWETEVDKIILDIYGVGIDDLPDMLWHDWFTEDMTPEEAAHLAIEKVNEDGY